jgi:hypothetical protein
VAQGRQGRDERHARAQLEKQGWAALLRAARAAKREDFLDSDGHAGSGSTQLIRAAIQNDLPRVLQLVQLGAPLDLACESGFSALPRACYDGHELIVRALLDGKYEGHGAKVNIVDCCG